MLYTININGRGVRDYDWTKNYDQVVEWFRSIVTEAKEKGYEVIESSRNLTAVINHGTVKLIEVVNG